MISGLILVLFGAILTGGVQTAIGLVDRRREADSVLVAICSEVAALCGLIRYQNYLLATTSLVDQIAQGVWAGETIVMDIRSNYFSVFESLSSQLGKLKPQHVRPIVQFYAYCKAAVDSTRPDGPMVNSDDKEGVANNLISLEKILKVILQLGDAIIQLPPQSASAVLRV